MKRAHILTFGEAPAPSALALLEASGAAAWAIDVAGGRILAANPAGGALLGLDGGASPPVLDGAMPALARLRALAVAPQRDGEEPETLVFWTRHGAVRPRCRIQILDAQILTAGPRALAIVTTLADPRPAVPSGPASEPSIAPSLRASLAHELKTPVSAIAAAAEAMKDERLGPLGTARYIGYAADIHGSARHMLGVIDRMLAEGAVEPVVPQHLDFAEIDACDVLRTTVSQLGPLAESSGIVLALDVAPGLPHVVADATSLRQILLNLVTNALKFTDRGGHIAVAARYAGEGPLTISVSDTGHGMAQNDIDRLLASGHARRPERQSDAGAGLGLGLPLVQALAAANGAELAIESVPGKGTSARVVFGKDRVIPV
jgi:signal transduction histidine kinase